jgi:phosphate transport system permease protein
MSKQPGTLNTHGMSDWTKRSSTSEKIMPSVLFAISLLSIITTVGIIVILFTETYGFFQKVSIIEFLTNPKWTPLFSSKNFGVMPLVAGTMMITFGACIVAVPLGLGSAIYLSEYAPETVRKVVKPILEVLAGIPTIVYGFFALTVVTPILKVIFPDIVLFNALSASIVVGIMILPMISSLSEDAMMAVPKSIRNGAYALGSTKLEVALKVVVPSAFSGITASIVLALSRAVGETMIVTIAAGSLPNLEFNYFKSIQTMTAYIVQVSKGDTPHGTIEYQTIFAVGMTLFLITLIMNIAARRISKRFKEEY